MIRGIRPGPWCERRRCPATPRIVRLGNLGAVHAGNGVPFDLYVVVGVGERGRRAVADHLHPIQEAVMYWSRYSP